MSFSILDHHQEDLGGAFTVAGYPWDGDVSSDPKPGKMCHSNSSLLSMIALQGANGFAISRNGASFNPIPVSRPAGVCNIHTTGGRILNHGGPQHMTAEGMIFDILKDLGDPVIENETLNKQIMPSKIDDLPLPPTPLIIEPQPLPLPTHELADFSMLQPSEKSPSTMPRQNWSSGAADFKESLLQQQPRGVSKDNPNADVGNTNVAMASKEDIELLTGFRFRGYQMEQWDEAFEELMAFRRVRGHCQVPHAFVENPGLARWVKRQRYQYKLMKEKKPCTMTHDRIKRLEEAGFVWDSHNTVWEERIVELQQYHGQHGHCNVPSAYCKNPRLATWVKCQRRQYKLFWQGKGSNITVGRINQLQSMGFEWSLRSRRS